MTVTTSWLIRVGYYDDGTSITLTDFTSRTLGMSVDVSAEVGQVGTRTATVTLDNNDGALTPGNGGTYSAWDWFERGLFIRAEVTDGTTTQNVDVFGGIVSDFTLDDDGRNSTVTITAVDAFQIIGRASPTTTYTAAAGVNTAQAFTSILADNVDGIPKIGQTTPSWTLNVTTSGSSDTQHRWDAGEISGAAGDVLNGNVMPSSMLTAVPSGANTGRWTLNVGRLTWSNNVLDFDESGGTAIPFRTIQRGFDTAAVSNTATLTTVDTGYVATSTETVSVGKYGARARTYTVTADGATYADPGADEWANRFAESTFDVRELVTSTSQVADQLADASFADWADALFRPCWQPFTVTFTPTGGTPVTENVVSAGYLITATPQDTVVRFRFVPRAVFDDFILDDTRQGVLGTNRLGAFS